MENSYSKLRKFGVLAYHPTTLMPGIVPSDDVFIVAKSATAHQMDRYAAHSATLSRGEITNFFPRRRWTSVKELQVFVAYYDIIEGKVSQNLITFEQKQQGNVNGAKIHS